jgi:hypothetical protein
VRGFVVGCLEGGGGGCGTSEDDVVSIDRERKGIKGDAICRRDACKAVDNMMRVRMQQGYAFAGCKSPRQIDHVMSHVPMDKRPGITEA